MREIAVPGIASSRSRYCFWAITDYTLGGFYYCCCASGGARGAPAGPVVGFITCRSHTTCDLTLSTSPVFLSPRHQFFPSLSFLQFPTVSPCRHLIVSPKPCFFQAISDQPSSNFPGYARRRPYHPSSEVKYPVSNRGGPSSTLIVIAHRASHRSYRSSSFSILPRQIEKMARQPSFESERPIMAAVSPCIFRSDIAVLPPEPA